MSFELLDFVNNLIVEETLLLPAQTLVDETDSKKLPSDERASRFRSMTEQLITSQQDERLTAVRAEFAAYKQTESLYQRALRLLPQSVDEVFGQIIKVVTSGDDMVPSSWTMAHRQEVTGKNHDEELKKIWVRMYMLKFISDKRDVD